MNRERDKYLGPLLAQGHLPLGALIYSATGEIYPEGAGMQDILADLQELCKAGWIRIERRHSARYRRIERTVHLTAAGRRMCGTKGGIPWRQ
ncbi:hypothetical protein LJB76_00880 [Clostridia bacterium OttesenSCG-928-O13]|nr:hypothetical protein [Clostridia bacterium OttesenSCG-928-O13]